MDCFVKKKIIFVCFLSESLLYDFIFRKNNWLCFFGDRVQIAAVP
jgi:hypothetical protein